MATRRYEATLVRTFAAPRPLVWALVADTDRWDRASGLAPGRYEWREVEGRRRRVGAAREMGFAIEWIEPPYQWVEGWLVEGSRAFLSGPAAAGGFRARLGDVDGGARVEATAWVSGDGPVMALIGPVVRARFRRALGRYLDAVAEVLARAEPDGDEGWPAVTRVRRALMAGYDVVTSGPRTPPRLEVLEGRARALRQAGVADAIAERLITLLREAPDESVAQIRPFELARLWDADRRDTLRAFLHATVAGLVDLRWQINCPVCRVSAGVVESLEDVRGEVHCHACNIGYDLDFGDHVEAVFQCNPAVRRVETAVYCASSPSFLPHVFAQLSVGPGQTREVPAELPPGTLRLRVLDRPAAAQVIVTEPGTIVELTLQDDSIGIDTRQGGADGGSIRVVNGSGRDLTMQVERAGWSADAVLGSIVASFPDFLDLFATEAPASGVDLSIGHLALLFSDLTGSTALYQRIGDARAFAIVEEHFRIMEEVVRRHGGALVKTMGDAVMASFAAPAGAVRAGLEMVAASDAAHAEHGLGVKLGVHAGPCLAVRANDRLDFFGSTVNIAARLQGQAEAGHLVVAEALLAHPEVEAALGQRPRRRYEAALKGIRGPQALVAVDARNTNNSLGSRAS